MYTRENKENSRRPIDSTSLAISPVPRNVVYRGGGENPGSSPTRNSPPCKGGQNAGFGKTAREKLQAICDGVCARTLRRLGMAFDGQGRILPVLASEERKEAREAVNSAKCASTSVSVEPSNMKSPGILCNLPVKVGAHYDLSLVEGTKQLPSRRAYTLWRSRHENPLRTDTPQCGRTRLTQLRAVWEKSSLGDEFHQKWANSVFGAVSKSISIRVTRVQPEGLESAVYTTDSGVLWEFSRTLPVCQSH